MGSALPFIFIGIVTLVGLYAWLRLRERLSLAAETEQRLEAANNEAGLSEAAVITASQHGQLLHLNERARDWLRLQAGMPDLEILAGMVQPSDNFLAVIAHEGQTSFQINGRWVEATSHHVPVDGAHRVVVMMREVSAQAPAANSDNSNGHRNGTGALDFSTTMRIIDEIGETINPQMGVEPALQTVLEILARALKANAGEITIWDDDNEALHQRGWIGDTAYLLVVAESGGQYVVGQGVAGWVAQYQQALLIRGEGDEVDVARILARNPYRGVVAVPLRLNERFVGTLALFCDEIGHFDAYHLSLVQAVSKAVATIVYNTILYANQQQRIEDIASLQQIAEQPKSNADATPIYAMLNERIAKLMGAEMCGIFLYDEDRQGLVPQASFYGLPSAVSQMFFIPLPEGATQTDIWRNQPHWVSNDLQDEPLVEALELRDILNVAAVKNTALFPMQVGGDRFGLVAVSNKSAMGGFTPPDLQNMRVLASQAAIVVENIRLYQAERRIDTELIGLQEMTHAIGALSHEGDFYLAITERIARLMNSAMCGVLLYDPDKQQLVAQPPFHGLPNDAIAHYAIPLPPNSVMAEIWEEEDFWSASNASANTLAFEAGLADFAAELGVKQTLISKMSAGGRAIGVIQVANKLDGSDYNDSDVRLLQIFATQAASIVENARLYQEVERRAQQAEGLRRIAELTSSVLTTEQSLEPVLAEIAAFMRSKAVYITVLDRGTNTLITYPRWVYGMDLEEIVTFDLSQPNMTKTAALSGRPFMTPNAMTDERILPPYKNVAQRFNLRETALVPLSVAERALGELGVSNHAGGQVYTDEDLRSLGTIAAQIAAAVDRLLLYERTGENLRRRMEELDAIARVSTELTLTQEMDPVLNVIRSEAIQATLANGCTVALFRPPNEWAREEEPEIERRLGDRALVVGLADIEAEAYRRGTDPVMVKDYNGERLRAMPSGARSGVAVPFLYLDGVVGVLHIHHREPNHFDDRAAGFLHTLATKAALAYQNYASYQEREERGRRLRRRVDQLNRIFELGQMLQTGADPRSMLEAIAYSVQQSVGYDVVLMTLVDTEDRVLRRVAHAGMPLNAFEESRRETLSLETLEEFLKDDYRNNETYFFPINEVERWYLPGTKALSTSFDESRTLDAKSKNAWHDGDMLMVRLSGSNGELLGLMILDRPEDNRRPDRSVMEVLEIFAHQAASMVENNRLFLDSQRSAEQELQLNALMERVASTLDLREIVAAIGEGVYDMMPYDRMTFALLDMDDQRQTVYDYFKLTPAEDGDGVHMEQDQPRHLERTAMGRSIDERSDYLYFAAEGAEELYTDLSIWHGRGEKSSLVLPLLTGGEIFGAMHLGTQRAVDARLAEVRPLMQRLAQLVAGSIQNARLFNQAVNLQILNRSVVESIQQGIVVLDQSGRILNFNAFMRQRYGWDDAATRRDLFAYRPTLAETLKEPLRDVLEQGVQRDKQRITGYQTDEQGHQIEQITSFFIYPLRSGETVRGAVLLVEDVTERTALEVAIQSRANQLAALTEVSTRITASLEREEVINLALNEIGWIIPYDTMSIWRRNGSYMVLEGSAGFELDPEMIGHRSRIGETDRVAQVVDSHRVVSVTALDPGAMGGALLPGEQPGYAWMGVPLVNQGHVVGMLVLTRGEAGLYDGQAEQNIAFAFASQVAIALANADLFEQTFERTNELGTLLEAAQATALTRDLDDVLRTVAELMFSALEMDECTIMSWDEVDNEVEILADISRDGVRPQVEPKGTRLSLYDYPGKRRALKAREVVVIVDTGDVEEAPYPVELEELRSTRHGARMLVPLVFRDEAIGLIQLEQQSNDEASLTQQKVRLARALGSQVAIAIQNARLTEETQSRFEEVLTINALSQAITSTLDLDDMLRIVRQQVPNVTEANEMYLALYDEATETINFPLAVRDGEDFVLPPRKLGHDEVSYIIRRRHSLSLGADYFSVDDLRKSMNIENGEGDIKSYMGVPLISGDAVLGVLAIRDTVRTRAFDINAERILSTVGSQLGAAIQNAKLFDQINRFADDLEELVDRRTVELEQERDRLDTLYQITSEVARTLDAEQLYSRALGMVSKAVGAEDGVIMISDPATDRLFCRASLDPDALVMDENSALALHPAEGLADWLVSQDTGNDHVIIVDDLHQENYWDLNFPGAARWRSALGVLLESNEDPLGVMVLLSSETGAFTENHLKLLVPAANQVASAISSADLYQLIRDQAEKLGKLLRQEQEEAQKNTAILEGIADGVMLADASSKVVLFNSAAERILQLPREQVLGQPVSRLASIYEASGITLAQMMQEWSKTSDPSSLEGDYISERIEIADKVISLTLSPVHNGGQFLGTVSVFRDITRDVEVARSKSQFIENVSHEFRTPLTPIKGYTDLLLMGATGDLNEHQTELLNRIKENAERLTVLVNDVLNIAKLDNEHQRLTMQLVDLNDVMPLVFNQIRGRSYNVEKKIDSQLHIADDVPPIRADRDKIMTILSNVIDNAFNYTLPDGKIEIRAQRDDSGDAVLITIADTGVGIPDDFRERVWQRFERYQDHAVDLDVAGTGLGLSLVEELVALHKGEVWFESELGRGTTFSIRLPLEQPNYITDTIEMLQLNTQTTAGD